MTIRKHWRHLCLAIFASFWSGCGENGNIAAPSVNPQSSTGNQSISSAAIPAESSSSVAPEANPVESSSSKEPEAARDTSKITLFSDPSVTCTGGVTIEEKVREIPNVPVVQKTCDDYKILLEKDTTYAETQLYELKAGLESCDDALCYENAYCVYGAAPSYSYIRHAKYTCTNGRTFEQTTPNYLGSSEEMYYPRVEDNVLYTTGEQYAASLRGEILPDPDPIAEEASSSSSEVESSSSYLGEAMNANLMDFVRIDEIVEDARKILLEKYNAEYATASEERKVFLDSIKYYLENALYSKIIPEANQSHDYGAEAASICVLRDWLDNNEETWFSGYIAKHQKQPDGSIITTGRYETKLDEVLTTLIDNIEAKYKPTSNSAKN